MASAIQPSYLATIKDKDVGNSKLTTFEIITALKTYYGSASLDDMGSKAKWMQ